MDCEGGRAGQWAGRRARGLRERHLTGANSCRSCCRGRGRTGDGGAGDGGAGELPPGGDGESITWRDGATAY